MKRILVLATTITLFSCTGSQSEPEIIPEIHLVSKVEGTLHSMFLEKVGNCEYIIVNSQYGPAVCHHGDCANPKHLQNQFDQLD